LISRDAVGSSCKRIGRQVRTVCVADVVSAIVIL
jgi:hypothetical protein